MRLREPHPFQRHKKMDDLRNDFDVLKYSLNAVSETTGNNLNEQ